MDFGRFSESIEHIGLVSVCLSSSAKSMKTSAAPYLEIRNPIVVYLMCCTQRVSQFYRMTHASSTWPLHFCHHSLKTFCLAVHQPDDAHKSTFPKSATIFGLVEQAFWRMPFFTEWSGASSFEVILARQSSHFPTWASASGTSGSRCIFHTLLRRRSRRKIWLCRFCKLIHIVSETAIVSFRTLPASFPLPTSPTLLCSRFFTL